MVAPESGALGAWDAVLLTMSGVHSKNPDLLLARTPPPYISDADTTGAAVAVEPYAVGRFRAWLGKLDLKS
jgi:hypothetical protein